MLPKNHCRTFGCLQKEVRFLRNPGQDATPKRRLRTHAAGGGASRRRHSLAKHDWKPYADEKDGKVSRAQSTVSFFAASREAKRMENEKRHAGESLIYFALEFTLASRGK
jgi:hypothetical protein